MSKAEFKVGDWTYDPSTLVVRYREGFSEEREVDLERCNTSAGMLDWIMWFSNKNGTTTEAIGDLVRILHILLHPQATLCSYEEEHGPIPTGNEMRDEIANRLKAREVFEQWDANLRAKQGNATFTIVSPADWQELRRMEIEAGVK
jgi:hypothetical protein